MEAAQCYYKKVDIIKHVVLSAKFEVKRNQVKESNTFISAVFTAFLLLC